MGVIRKEAKMTNILTWNIKPIKLPNVNSNLLSVISLTLIFTLLFTMVYPAVETAAQDTECNEIIERVRFYASIAGICVMSFGLLWHGLKAALATGSLIGLIAVIAGFAVAGIGAVTLSAMAAIDYEKYLECLDKQESENATGGCDSGGCGIG